MAHEAKGLDFPRRTGTDLPWAVGKKVSGWVLITRMKIRFGTLLPSKEGRNSAINLFLL